MQNSNVMNPRHIIYYEVQAHSAPWKQGGMRKSVLSQVIIRNKKLFLLHDTHIWSLGGGEEHSNMLHKTDDVSFAFIFLDILRVQRPP